LIDLTADSREAVAATGGAPDREATNRPGAPRGGREGKIGKGEACGVSEEVGLGEGPMSRGRVIVSEEADGVERCRSYSGTFRSVRQWRIEPGGQGDGGGSAPSPVSLTIRNSRASAVHRYRTHRCKLGGPTM
ncbi:hypothetical protein B296_00052229, partial [Ensete ventricosum]